MPSRNHLVILLAIVFSVCIGWTAHDETRSKTVWEYKVVSTGTTEFKNADLNELGRQGWELIAVDHPIQNASSDYHLTYYLKRSK
jgi:hypothetical protein